MRIVGVRIGLVAALVASTAVLVAPAAHAGVTINVPASQPTIQAGIDAASAGDTVVVAPGTYFERIDFKGKAIEVRSSAGPATTIIDGGGAAGSIVTFKSGETRASVLRGVTVAHGGGRLHGLGILIDSASPTVVGNVVTDNNSEPSTGAGLGISIERGSPLIQANEIARNRGASIGGGIWASADGYEIIGNIIEGNSADFGGGLSLDGHNWTLRGNLIRGNTGRSVGGGVLMGPGGLLVDNIIVDNVAVNVGGGVLRGVQGEGDPTSLVNNTVTGNQAPKGSAVALFGAGSTLVNNVFTGAAGSSTIDCESGAEAGTVFSHNDVFSAGATPYVGCADPTGTSGNISADPSLSASYTPQPGSPAIDAGDGAAASLPATDFFGHPRVTDGDGDGVAVVDMGAVESAPITVTGERYHPLTPARILDTRTAVGAPAAKLGPASTLAVQVTGQGGVPATGVSAVVLNVTVTQPTSESFLTAWPAGVARPTASNLNFPAGQTVPNLVVVKVGAGGQVDLYNNAGAAHVVADVAGWYGGTTDGARYTAVTPARILDTRTSAKVGPASTLAVQVTGQGGVPATGVSAVVLNVTVTQPTSESFLTAWPAGVARPTASNLNFLLGQTVPNLVIVKVGAGGQVNLYNNAGSTHVVADVAGWYGADGAPGGAGFSSVTPARILDTRTAAKVGPGATLDLQVAGQGGVPTTGVTSVVLNVTATQPTAESFLTAWPAGVTRPTASNLNFLAGQTVANLVVVKVGAGGKVSLYNNAGATHILVDVAGWYSD